MAEECALHEDIAQTLSAQGCFAHPYHFWERGLNENANGLMRRYVPKGSSIDNLSHYDTNNLMKKLNYRPRKCLDFKTPNQLLLGIDPPIAPKQSIERFH